MDYAKLLEGKVIDMNTSAAGTDCEQVVDNIRNTFHYLSILKNYSSKTKAFDDIANKVTNFEYTSMSPDEYMDNIWSDFDRSERHSSFTQSAHALYFSKNMFYLDGRLYYSSTHDFICDNAHDAEVFIDALLSYVNQKGLEAIERMAKELGEENKRELSKLRLGVSSSEQYPNEAKVKPCLFYSISPTKPDEKPNMVTIKARVLRPLISGKLDSAESSYYDLVESALVNFAKAINNIWCSQKRN